MTEPTIVCPQCKTEIPVAQSLAGPVIEKLRREFAAREVELAGQAARQLEEARAGIVRAEREKVAAELARAQAAQKENDARMAEMAKRLGEAQEAQAAFKKKERALEDARRELNLTIETRVQATAAEILAKVQKEADEAAKLQLKERDVRIAGMLTQIEELKRRAEQGSQQLQGEVQELALEDLLASRFPGDSVEPVAKGQSGADTLQRVLTPAGAEAGTILWECKRTKNWSDAWLPKLRTDQRAAGADLAVIVTQAMPKGVEHFEEIDGVWVVSARVAGPVALVLRASLLQAATARKVSEGQLTKRDLVYRYLTGPAFRHRISAALEAATTMQEDLQKERRAIEKQWSKRHAQIQRLLSATTGMVGDLQGLAGKSFQEIEGLEVGLLGAGPGDLFEEIDEPESLPRLQ